jgi:hypothetical protein
MLTAYQVCPYAMYGALALAVPPVIAIPRGRWRWTFAVAALLIVAGSAFAARILIVHRIGEGRLAVLLAMKARPNDPWPRGSGHVPLGAFGAAESRKGWLEPGGSFSPAAGTFGISLWVVAPDGALITTSDSIPLEQTRSRYTGSSGIAVDTPYYTATWTVRPEGGFKLALNVKPSADYHIEVAFRGVGPAGGPLTDIVAGTDGLRLAGRWTISPAARLTFLGEEGEPGWTRPNAPLASAAHSVSGWAAARVAAPAGETFIVTVSDPSGWQSITSLLGSGPMMRGLDPVFTASLRSQIETLLQGLVGQETRPGDPLNYPLQWQRDGAYVIVALARAGQIELAERLATRTSREDFFGGFGAEADAPGLALWALGEVSALGTAPDWPDVERKVALIEQMLHATSDFRHDFSGPAVPAHRGNPELTLVAGPSRDGLINGRMDWHRPVFFVNAVSYAGLIDAVRIANRLGHTAQAVAWTKDAEALRRSWQAAFVDPARAPDAADDRTAISGLWPADIASPPAFDERLERRWHEPSGHPLWTYFTIAEAHQWLRLGRPDRVWQTLDWLWTQQPQPGLFTLWEGSGEENGFGLWKTFRGWVRPEHVTPHYWSAGEMLLLQLAMLAETHRGQDSDELVIGAGVPAIWLSREIAVSGVGTAHGFVDWTWNGAEVSVTIHGPPLPVRLGQAFPAGTKVVVTIK